MTAPEYSYCESVYASSISPWHIRRLTATGKKTSGGIDTPSLCGRVQPPYGWDLEVEVSEKANAEWLCAKCREMLTIEKEKP